MKYLILSLCLIIVFVSCSSDKKEISQDNITDDKPIESIVLSSDTSIDKGNRLFLDGKFDEAITYYQESLDANKAIAYYNIGVCYFLMEEYEKSRYYFEAAYKLDNSFTESYINLAASLLQLNRFEEAEKIITELKDYTNSAKFLINAANTYLKIGNTAKAYYYFQEASKQAKDEPFFKSSYGAFLISIGEYEKGVDILEDLADKDYSDYFNLALAYYKLNYFDTSIVNAKNALEIKETIEAYELMGKNYEQLHDYVLAAESYRNVLRFTDEVHFRLQYALNLFKSGDYDRALDILDKIVSENPKQKEAYLLQYLIYDTLNDLKSATNVIEKAYANIQDSEILYKYVWHYLIRLNKPKEVLNTVFSKRYDPDLSNLLKALYYTKLKDYKRAKSHLDSIKNLKNSDYYYLLGYNYLKSKQYKKALNAALNIDKNNPERLWFEFILNWNLKNQKRLLEIADEFLNYVKIFNRKPKISVQISPVIDDFDLSFPYNNDFEDILRLSLTPIVIDPDEMLDFLALGYKLLTENEKQKALEELKKSVTFSNAIESNTKGVKAFFEYDFNNALKHFKEADENLKNNSIIFYNIGITYLNLGDKGKAYEFFDKAILFNRFTLQAYLGKAAIYKTFHEILRSRTQYDLLLSNYENMKATTTLLNPYFEIAKYFALIGLGNYNAVIDEFIVMDNRTSYHNLLLSLAYYFKDKDIKYMENINKLNVFRNREIVHLSKLHSDLADTIEIDSSDICYKNMLANILITKGEKYTFHNIVNEATLKDEIYRNIYTRNFKEALRLMQIFSKKYFRSAELYKVSLYYFLVVNDQINAEASINILKNLGAKDIYVDYYKILFYLIFFNGKFVADEINSYIENYPYDFRGLAADAILAFKNSNFKNLKNDIINIYTLEPDFLKKISLEINFEDL